MVVSCDDEYSKPIASDLYLTGLTYEYSTSTIDNIAVLKKNYEQVFQLDYLENVFYKDVSYEIVKRTNLNYIIPFIKLYDHYKLSGELQKANGVKEKLLNISKGMPEEVDITNYFNQ